MNLTAAWYTFASWLHSSRTTAECPCSHATYSGLVPSLYNSDQTIQRSRDEQKFFFICFLLEGGGGD
jgi:hypothetical protein